MTALVLFDFDGTLADTAPDLAAAANLQRTRRGWPEMDYALLRPVASQGARGLLRVAVGLKPEDEGYEAARLQFLKDYAANSTVLSRLFAGIPELLAEITARGLRWGIVTNKSTKLTVPIVDYLGLNQASAVLVCGDTTPHSKPHPEPLLHAAREAGFAVDRCIYVGDDLRDVQAARAAGMPVVAAAYGYLGDNGDATTWEADACATTPQDLWAAIEALLPEG
jgi:2-phosphoglycolate phosphatase